MSTCTGVFFDYTTCTDVFTGEPVYVCHLCGHLRGEDRECGALAALASLLFGWIP